MRISFQEDDDDVIADLIIRFDSGDSEQLQRIVRGPLRESLIRFAAKNRGYATATQSRFPNYVTGEYVELERKLGKLWAGFIAGDKDAFKDESAHVILDDMLGHILLMKDCLNLGSVL